VKLRRVDGYRLKGSGVCLVLKRRGFGGFLMERRLFCALYPFPPHFSTPFTLAIAHSPRSFLLRCSANGDANGHPPMRVSCSFWTPFLFLFLLCLWFIFFLLIPVIEGLAITLVWNRSRGLGKGREYWVFDDLDPKSPHFYSCHSWRLVAKLSVKL